MKGVVSDMFQKILEYAGPYKKTTFLASAVILLGVFMSVLPFIFACQIIAPLIEGEPMDLSYAAVRIAGVLVCLVLHACLYVKGLSLSHEAAYNILMRIRISLQNRMEKLPLGLFQ